jgi:cobalamin biosynthetic protein CobC
MNMFGFGVAPRPAAGRACYASAMQTAERHLSWREGLLDGPPEHGGDLAAIRAAFPQAPQPWIDLSTGINPWPYPLGQIPRAAWQTLPSSADLERVRIAAAAHYGTEPARVVLAPGSQAVIQWLPRLRGRSRVTVLGPTYDEHARSWAACGHQVTFADSLERIGRDIDVVVVGRPNNPDGRVASFSSLTETATRVGRRGGWLIVDEAFADVMEAPSIAAVLHSEAVISLRSFGKFFGLAGGRLGAALLSGTIRADLERALGPWPVSGPMLDVAARAFADEAWIARTRERLAKAAARLDRLALRARLQLVGGTTLFRLYETPRAPQLFDALAAAGVYVRRFAGRPTWLRLGLPPTAEAERRLSRALASEPPQYQRGKEPVDLAP